MFLATNALWEGLVYALLTLGVYITFRVLSTPDLTTDGSFVLGMAVSAVFSAKGMPLVGLLVGMLAGAAAGFVTGFLQTNLGIHPVLSGILTMFGLQSINYFIMKAPNISLIDKNTVYKAVQGVFPALSNITVMIIIPLIACILIAVLLWLFFGTQLGLSIRATGDNPEMVKASSINVGLVIKITFAISNALIALSGAMMAQAMKSADINFGTGIVTIGLASVIIGEMIFGKRGINVGIISAVVGALIYKFAIAFAINVELFPAMALKLVSALIIGLALAVPIIKKKITLVKDKSKRRKGNA